MPPRFVAGAGQLPPLFDDHPRAIPADLVGSVGHMLNDRDREAFRAGPATAEEELAYAQRVAAGAHMAAVPAPPAAQDRFRRLRQFDQRRFFLAPDGNLYERGDTTAENPGWTLRRQMRGLAGPSGDPTLDDLMHRHFQFVNEETGAPTDDGQRSAPTSMPQPLQVPQITIERERRQSILDDTPGEFPIAPDPDAYAGERWYSDGHAGAVAVREFHRLVEEEARRAGVDPLLLLSILYVENAHGHCGGAADMAEDLGRASSLFPMNIKPHRWRQLSPYGDDLSDPRSNVAAAAILLKRISERVPDGDIAKIAALYHGLGQEIVDSYGARVAEVYCTRPWQADVPTIGEWDAP